MIRFSCLLSLLVFLTGFVYAQTPQDSLPSQPDSTPERIDPAPRQIQEPSTPVFDSAAYKLMADSFSIMPKRIDSSWKIDPNVPLAIQILKRHPYFGFAAKAETAPVVLKKSEGKELLFYCMVGLLLIFAFLRQAFSKYFNDLFRLFFRTTLKYRQIREQLMQTPLPSLLLNTFFVVSGGLYISFLLIHFELIDKEDYWLYAFYGGMALIVIYLVKFLGLKVLGWIFHMPDAADSYIFVVFVINKVIGVFLLPFVIMLAFMTGTGYEIALILSWFGIGALLLYRFILTFAAVRNQVKLNPFHFLLYLIAFEIAPLLLIYKLLLVFFQ